MEIKQLNAPSLRNLLPFYLQKIGKNFSQAALITVLANSFNILMLPTPEARACSTAGSVSVSQNAFEALPDLDIAQSLLSWDVVGFPSPTSNVLAGEALPDLDITQNLLADQNQLEP